MLREDQIRRYARHVLLPDVGGAGQRRLLDAAVAVDLGDPAGAPAAIVAATYLAAAGVGTIALTGGARPATAADVAGGIALAAADAGRPVGAAVAARLAAINPDVRCPDTPPAAAVPLALAPGAAPGAADALVAGGLAACRLVHAIATGRPAPAGGPAW